MLTTENSSCSSKVSDLASGHEDHQSHPPNFSIRDYVFKSRSKDIRVTWPFGEQLLQLCLDNGITDLLPPLQPPSLVRAHCFRKQVDSEFIENKTVFDNLETEEKIKRESLLPINSSESRRSLPKERRILNSFSMTSHDLSEGILNEQMKKRCKLATKSDLLLNPITVSDPMASKVCPVCKSFTSSSNTTLNAHIDRCLSSDKSDAIKDASDLQKHRVRPRKKRLMVDIYKIAHHCTLEDLDRRNGTNWAVTLAPVPPADDVIFAPSSPANDNNNIEMKRTKSDPSVAVRKGNVGDIYVDSNGTKLLILSNFDDSPSSDLRKSFKLKKILKKKVLKQKVSVFMNANPQKRKLRRFKVFKGKNVAAPEEDHITKAYKEKEESASRLFNSHDQVKHSEPSTLRHWVGSKRSDLSRKLDIKGISKESISRKLLTRCTLSEPAYSSIQRNHAPNSSTSSETVNILKTIIVKMDSGKKITPLPSNLNSKLLSEADCHMAKRANHSESSHPSLKARKSSTLKKSGLSRTCISLEGIDKVERFIPPKKFKKRKSMLGCSKRRGEKNYVVNGGIDNSTADFGLVSSIANEASVTHQSNFSDYQQNLGMTPACDANLEPRDETQEELSAETTTYNKKAQCGYSISNEAISQYLQMSDHQAKEMQHEEINEDCSAIEEPNPDNGDKVPEITQGNSSTTFVGVASNQDYSMNLNMDSSASVSPSSPVDVNIKCSETGQLSKDAPLHDELSSSTMRKDNKMTAREPSCSCSESLSRESQFLNRKNTISNLFIKPSAPSPFQIYPSLESHTESVITTDSSQSSMNVSTPCSRVQSASNPILRLMGKDLVVSKEEKLVPSATKYISEPKFISFGIPTNVGFISYNNHYHYQFQAMGNHQIPLQPMQESNKLNSPSHYNLDRVFASHNHQPKPIIQSNQAREIIVIDDESHGLGAKQRANFSILPQPAQHSNIMTSQSMFACYPSHNPYQRGTSQGSFVFPSSSSVYFSPNLRFDGSADVSMYQLQRL